MDRRNFIKSTSVLGAATALAGCATAIGKNSHALGSDRVKVGLVGCGGRGTGALRNMIEADQNIKVVALADLFPDKIVSAKKIINGFLSQKYPNQKKDIFDSEKVKTFTGFDAIDGLLAEDVDVVIEATPPVFRTPHYEKIVKANKNAFLEKPACIDITQARKMLELADEADRRGLSVVCGTQRRYHAGYQEAIKRLQDGQIGDIVSTQCYWNSSGYVGDGQYKNLVKSGVMKGLTPDDMEYQIRDWFAFIWTSGDHIVEQHVHNIDVIMWGLGDNRFPVEVRGFGGRSTDLPTPEYGDRFSHFAIDFDMGNGLRLASFCQQDPKTASEQAERFIGTKGILYSSLGGKIVMTDLKGKVLWNAPTNINCLVDEHRYLLNCLRNGVKVNKIRPLVNSTLLAIAGRMSAFSGRKFKFDWMIKKSKENIVPENISFRKNPLAGVPVPGKYQLS